MEYGGHGAGAPGLGKPQPLNTSAHASEGKTVK